MIYILFIVGFIFYSGAISSLKKGISYILTRGKIVKDSYNLKPFDCPLCLTFWLSIIYVLITSTLTLQMLLFCCINAYFANYIQLIYRYLDYLIEKLTKFLLK